MNHGQRATARPSAHTHARTHAGVARNGGAGAALGAPSVCLVGGEIGDKVEEAR